MNALEPENDAETSDATADDTTSTDDATSTDDNTTDSTTASSNANQEIAAEIELLKTDLATNDISADEVQTKWNTFSSKLATEYPQISEQISQLSTITEGLTDSRQWTAFINLVSEKIIQLQGTDDVTPTATADAAGTASHTNSDEDLKWLFEHRNSHDNQATW